MLNAIKALAIHAGVPIQTAGFLPLLAEALSTCFCSPDFGLETEIAEEQAEASLGFLYAYWLATDLYGSGAIDVGSFSTVLVRLMVGSGEIGAILARALSRACIWRHVA